MAEIQKIKVGNVTYTLNDTTARSWMNTSKKSMYWGYNNIMSYANRDILRNNAAGGFRSFSSGGTLLTFGSKFYRQVYSTSTKNNVVTDKLNAREEMADTLKKENVKNVFIIGNWFSRYAAGSAGTVMLGLNASSGTGNWYNNNNGGNNLEQTGSVAPNAETEFRLNAPGEGYNVGASGIYQFILGQTEIGNNYNLCIVHSVGGSKANVATSTYAGLRLRVFYFGGYA